MAERARPVLAAPLIPGDDAVVGQHVGGLVGDRRRPRVRQRGAGAAPPRARRRTSRGPRSAPGIGVTGRRARSPRAARRRARCRRRRRPAAPRPAANGPSAASRALATQFSATPPAMVRVDGPTGRVVQPAGQVEQHLLQPELDARGEVGVLLGHLAVGRSRPWPAPSSRSRSTRNPPSPVRVHQVAQQRRGTAAGRTRPAPSPCTRRWSAGSPGAGSGPRRAGRASAAARWAASVCQARRRGRRRPDGWPPRRGRRAPAPPSRRRWSGAARPADAACATWCGTNRTCCGSSPGSAVARNCGARVAYCDTQAVPRVASPSSAAPTAPGRTSRRPRRGRPGRSPASARHHAADCSGSSQAENGTGRLPCLRRLNRSSSAAATTGRRRPARRPGRGRSR